MFLIENIDDDPNQANSIVLEDGSQLDFTLQYKDNQAGWFFTSLVHPKITILGMRVVTSPNILYQYSNQLNFGIACFVTDNQEPTLQTDFSSGRAQLYLLSAAEVINFQRILSGEVSA